MNSSGVIIGYMPVLSSKVAVPSPMAENEKPRLATLTMLKRIVQIYKPFCMNSASPNEAV